jgi:vancomycin resistance protein YoaR
MQDDAASSHDSAAPRITRAYRVLLAFGALVLAAGLFVVDRSSETATRSIGAGVFLGSAPLGEIDPAELDARIEALATELEAGELTLVHRGRELVISLSDLGAKLDRRAAAEAVRALPSEGPLVSRWRTFIGRRSALRWSATLDRARFEEGAALWEVALVQDLPVDGDIVLAAVPLAIVAPKSGARLDREALHEAIVEHLAHARRDAVEVPVRTVEPVLQLEQIERAAADARSILEGPITLTHEPTEEERALAERDRADAELRRKEEEERARWQLPKSKRRMKRKGRRLVEEAPKTAPPPTVGPQPIEIVFARDELVESLRVVRSEPSAGSPPTIRVEFDEAALRKKIAPYVGRLFDASRDARFDIDTHGKVTIVPSRPGSRVALDRLVPALLSAAATPGRRSELPVDRNAQPRFTTEAAEALGIKELVAQFTTYHPCCQPRVQNIHRIADMLDGTIVKPGETLSVNAVVGPRTLARGFVLAPSIGDGEMIDTPGGGVSQYATTLFNALFDGGFTVRERQPHSFYFNRYPMGIEATLSWPSPDLVFYNDTKSAVLLRSEYTDKLIRVKLFGDREGRRVVRKVSAPFDYVDPRIEYEADASLEPDDEEVREKGSTGFSVTVSRTIRFADGTSRDEKRTIHYKPRPRRVTVHPCRIPKGEPAHTGERCPETDLDTHEAAGGRMPHGSQ